MLPRLRRSRGIFLCLLCFLYVLYIPSSFASGRVECHSVPLQILSRVAMVGYGALHPAFRHPQLFSSVSAHSAALIEKLPAFVSTPQSPRSRILGGVFGIPPDIAFWNANSPLTLARSANLSGLNIYFDCGDQDDYGFDGGATALDKILTARKIAHEFHIYPGRHDPGYFAAHIPASLAFHSALF